MALATVVFSLLVLGAQLFGKSTARAEPADDQIPEAGPESTAWPAVLGLQAAYILGIYLLGFTTATLLYLILAPLQMQYRRWNVIVLQAVFLTAVISGSFIWFFHIRLPKGILWSLW